MVSENRKNKIGIAVVIIVAVIINALSIYTSLSDKKSYISGADTDSSLIYDLSNKFVSDKDCLKQYFEPLKQNLEEIEVRFKLTADKEIYTQKDNIILSIYDSHESLIWKDTLSMNDVTNDKYLTFQIGKTFSVSETYSLVIQCDTDATETVQSIVVSPNIKENKECFFDNQELNNELDVIYHYTYVDITSIMMLLGTDIALAICILIIYKIKKKNISLKKDKIRSVIIGVLTPIILYVLYELIQNNLFKVQPQYTFINIFIFSLSFWGIGIIIGNFKIASIIYSVLVAVLGLVEYYVLLFRGRPFMLVDLKSISTAKTVVGSYKIEIDPSIGIKLLCVLFLIIVVINFQHLKMKKTWIDRVLRIIICIVGIGLGYGINNTTILQDITGDEISFWDLETNYQDKGSIYTLILECQYNHVKKPEGYSIEKVKQIIEKTKKNKQTETKTNAEKIQPENIILIMNESFADMRHIGSIKTNMKILPYISNLQENTTKGWLQIPVFGAGTAESEYEVLTGNSKQFLPLGSTAYESYCQNTECTVASVLKKSEYQTYALHPFWAANWNRSSTYPRLGFDQFFSLENWNEKIVNIRWCASDLSVYEKIKNIISNKKKGEKTFVFSVTMQNHGGYDEDLIFGFEPQIKLDYERKYPKAEAYLSLANESDIAFKNLISYFKQLNEPTMVIMFGDHYPNVEEEFYDELYRKKMDDLTLEETQLKYQTPYIIWTNYQRNTSTFGDSMSANYLGAYILREAGVQMPLFEDFLLQTQSEIPIIGMNAVKCNDGNWYSMDNLPLHYQEILEKYRMIQYNKIVDRKNQYEDFYG